MLFGIKQQFARLRLQHVLERKWLGIRLSWRNSHQTVSLSVKLRGLYSAGVEKLRPAGRMRPARAFCAACRHGRNFVAKCGGDSLVWNQVVIGSMQKRRFIYTDSQSYF